MKTIYEPKYISPFQIMERKMLNTQSKGHPVAEEVQKSVGTYELSATFEEDSQTLQTLKHVPGLIAFICTLKKGTQIIGQGRGMAVLNKVNRFIERTVRAAFNASLVDAVVRSKMLDALHLEVNKQNSATLGEAYRATETEGDELASERQKSYLINLVNANVEDDSERERWMSQIEGMDKWSASEAIQSFAK